MNTERGPDENRTDDRRTSLEQYLRMDEKEKDAEIQKAVARLQKRIQEILYVLEADMQESNTTSVNDSAAKDPRTDNPT